MSKHFHIWFSPLRASLDPQPLPSLNGLFSNRKQTEYLQYTYTSWASRVHCKVWPLLIPLREHPPHAAGLQGVSEEAVWRKVSTSGHILHELKLLQEGEDKDICILVTVFTKYNAIISDFGIENFVLLKILKIFWIIFIIGSKWHPLYGHKSHKSQKF